MPPPGQEKDGALWVWVGVSPQGLCSLCAPGVHPAERAGNAKLDLTPSYLTPGSEQADSPPAHAFTFNCLDIRVIRQLNKGNLFARAQ